MFENVFRYENGVLFWIERDESEFKTKRGHSIHLGRYANKQAGHKGVNGYIEVRYNKRLYLAHRVIWELHNGPIEKGFEIDHINRKRDDNRIENLRLVNSQQNKWNMSKPSHNTSGFKGVTLHKPSGRFIATIKRDGVSNHLGYFDTAEQAYNAYMEASKKYHDGFFVE